MVALSIIVPVYNSEKTLKRCIDSILDQSFKDFELILINDGSNDSSATICKEYCESNVKVKFFNTDNSGVSSARNKGILESIGKYILFCDSDDVVYPNWCKELYYMMEHTQGELGLCGYESIYYKSNINYFYEEKDYSLIESKDFFLLRKKCLFNCVWNKIFISSIIKNNGIKFEANLSLGEDTIFVLNYISKIKKIAITNKILYSYYRDDKDSLSNQYNKNLFEIYTTIMKTIRYTAKNIQCEWTLYKEEYYTDYFEALLTVLENTFHEKNKDSFYRKIRTNNRILNSTEFSKCLRYSKKERYNNLFISILKVKNYFIFYIFCKIYKIKNNLLKDF